MAAGEQPWPATLGPAPTSPNPPLGPTAGGAESNKPQRLPLPWPPASPYAWGAAYAASPAFLLLARWPSGVARPCSTPREPPRGSSRPSWPDDGKGEKAQPASSPPPPLLTTSLVGDRRGSPACPTWGSPAWPPTLPLHRLVADGASAPAREGEPPRVAPSSLSPLEARRWKGRGLLETAPVENDGQGREEKRMGGRAL